MDEIISSRMKNRPCQGNVDDIRYESGESIDQLFRHEFKAFLGKGDSYVLEFSCYEFKMSTNGFALYAAVLSLSVIIELRQCLINTYYQDKGVVMLFFLALWFWGPRYHSEYLNLDFDGSTI